MSYRQPSPLKKEPKDIDRALEALIDLEGEQRPKTRQRVGVWTHADRGALTENDGQRCERVEGGVATAIPKTAWPRYHPLIAPNSSLSLRLRERQLNKIEKYSVNGIKKFCKDLAAKKSCPEEGPIDSPREKVAPNM